MQEIKHPSYLVPCILIMSQTEINCSVLSMMVIAYLFKMFFNFRIYF